ncbi:dCMP deaminase family protein [Verrucomicrobia bacterium]|nr:dCMP deaminase family protein [Verrucomicrobiota bacterium]
MANQNKLDERYLAMAKEWSKMSHAKRKKVGCLIVKDEQIISDGYNGTPSGFNNDCEEVFYTCDERDFYRDQEWQLDVGKDKFYKLKTKPEVLHAESNALMKLARSTNSSEGATIYCTYSPCFDCAKLIVQSGVKRFVYNETYRNIEGLNLLKEASVEIVNYE